MKLTDEQMDYLRNNSIPNPSAATLALIERASQLDGKAITQLHNSGWMWVELAVMTSRTTKELQNAF